MENFILIMRKVLIPTISFLLLLLAASCAKDSPVISIEPVRAVYLHAKYCGGSATKTQIDSMTTSHSAAMILWSKEDSLSLFWDNSGTVENSRFVTGADSASEAIFYPAPPSEPTGTVIGLYPRDPGASANISSSTVSALLPCEQNGIAGTFDPRCQIAVGITSAMPNMAFYNVCSGICFTLTSAASTYSKIVLRGLSGEVLAGNITISLANPTSPAVSFVGTPTDADKSISLIPDGGAFVAGKDYYISSLPVNFSKGFEMEFHAASGVTKRTCTAEVPFNRGRFVYITEVDSATKLSKIRSGLDLASPNPANCYIISSPGCYKFPLVKGNNISNKLDNVSSLQVLWETDNTSGSQTAGSIIAEVAMNKGYAYITTPTTLKNGNALIAAVSGDGTKLWSWHIWVCSGYDPVASQQTLSGKSVAMMDRNLGALSEATKDPLANGFFYQWGRKDPFPGAAQASGGTTFKISGSTTTAVAADVNATVDYAIANPTTFLTDPDETLNGNWLLAPDNNLWGATKTIYDPCPQGWKVPDDAWSGVPYHRYANGTEGYGTSFRLSSTTETWTWYPCSGFLNISGILRQVGTYSCYWSYSVSALNSYAMECSQAIDTGKLTLTTHKKKYRAEGHLVRCIAE